MDDLPENAKPIVLETTVNGLEEGVNSPEHIPFYVKTEVPDGSGGTKQNSYWTRVAPNIEGKTLYAETDATGITFSVCRPVVDGYELDTRYYATYAKVSEDNSVATEEREVTKTGDAASIALSDIVAGTPIRVENNYIKSTKEYGRLNVTEAATGEKAEEKTFHYTITFARTTGETPGPATDLNCYYPESGIYVKDGKAEFDLKDKETVSFTMLENDLNYEVTVASEDGYTETHTGEKGTILAGNTLSATFTHQAKDIGTANPDGDETQKPDDNQGNSENQPEIPTETPDDNQGNSGNQPEIPDDGKGDGGADTDNEQPSDSDSNEDEQNPANDVKNPETTDGTQNKPNETGEKNDNETQSESNQKTQTIKGQTASTPNLSDHTENVKMESPDSPKTGLTDHIGLWIGAGIVLSAAAVALFFLRKKLQ